MENIIRTNIRRLQADIDRYDENAETLDEMNIHEIKDENTGENMIITSGPLYVLEDLGISVIEGTYCNYNEEIDDYEPDWSLTLVYDTANIHDFDYNNYAYYEQDLPVTALHNYLNQLKRRADTELLPTASYLPYERCATT